MATATQKISLDQRLKDAICQAGGGEKELEWIQTPAADPVWQRIGQLVMHAIAVAATVFTMMVDYSRSVADLIKDGAYNYANPNITDENFPLQPFEMGQEKEAKLYHFNRDISSDAAISEMAKDGFRPATARELLTYGAKNPEVQREFPIVALGSVWLYPNGFRHVVFLVSALRGRNADLYWYVDDWGSRYRFLAVRKKSSDAS